MKRGKIKAYSADVNAGVISGEDGKQYGFGKAEWTGDQLPEQDEPVQFDGQARRAQNVSSKR